MNEKKKLLTHRLVWLGILILIILLPIIINACQPKLELVDSECLVEYNDYLNSSDCEITLYFNRNVNSGYAEINFYDASDNLIDTCNCYLLSDGKTAYDSWVYVSGGNVKSYEIVSYDIEPNVGIYGLYGLLIIVIPMLISSLLLSYKECTVEGKVISVYAGFYHHTLRINGELCDEHNTLISFTSIKLSTTSGETKVEATISLTNRIAIKVNDKICK